MWFAPNVTLQQRLGYWHLHIGCESNPRPLAVEALAIMVASVSWLQILMGYEAEYNWHCWCPFSGVCLFLWLDWRHNFGLTLCQGYRITEDCVDSVANFNITSLVFLHSFLLHIVFLAALLVCVSQDYVWCHGFSQNLAIDNVFSLSYQLLVCVCVKPHFTCEPWAIYEAITEIRLIQINNNVFICLCALTEGEIKHQLACSTQMSFPLFPISVTTNV